MKQGSFVSKKRCIVFSLRYTGRYTTTELS